MRSSRTSTGPPHQRSVILTMSLEMKWSLASDVKHTMATHSSLTAPLLPLATERTRRRMSRAGVGTSILMFSGAAL